MLIEEGEIYVFDVRTRHTFVAASRSEHSGTGPYHDLDPDSGSISMRVDASWHPAR